MDKLPIAFSILLLLGSCQKESSFKKDETGAIIEKDYIWKKPLTQNQFIWSGRINVPIFKDKFITATHFEENAKLTALNIFTGETEWEWNDYLGIDQDTVFLDLKWPYIYENLLLFQKGPRSYCIDMVTGQTTWRKESGHTFHNYLGGTDDEFLSKTVIGDTLGYEIEFDFIGDVFTGERHSIQPPKFEIIDNTGKIGIRSTRGNLFEANGKQYFLSTYAKFSEHWIALPFLALYNRTDAKWEYTEKQVLSPHLRNVVANFPVIIDDIVVTSIGYHMCANDLWTGDSLWVYDCKGGFDTGGFFIHGGRIYTLAKQAGLYCLDLYMGNVIWHQTRDDIGYGSKMSYLNGVIYTTHGTLVALDMETGGFLWDIESPDGEGFKDVAVYIGGDGERSLVLAATFQNAYCYEAVK